MSIPADFIRPSDLVFDIGAHLGVKTKSFADAGARVVAFEANPELATRMAFRFAKHPSVFIENKALASSIGLATLNICSRMPTISTCTKEWTSGRFKDNVWDKAVTVPATTLDAAIAFFGTPRFIKIDVEGFEYEVLSGLSQPVDYLCFEFTAEFSRNMSRCMEHLCALGMTEFNIGLGEHDTLHLPQWVSAEQIENLTNQLGLTEDKLWGDVYAKLS